MSRSRALVGRGLNRSIRRLAVAPQRRRRLVVEPLEDLVLLATTITVTNANPSGAGSLDAAIRTADSEASMAPFIIDFNIGTAGTQSGPVTIMVGGAGSEAGSRFETIHVPITFDGWSEGDFQDGTTSGTYDGSPLIVVDGTDVTTDVGPGLDFEGESSSGPGSTGSAVEGMDFVNWNYVPAQGSGGTAIEMEGAGPVIDGIQVGPSTAASDIAVQGCYIGVGPNGMTPMGNDVYGILDQGNDNTIGGTTAAATNIIADNGSNTSSGETGAGVGVYAISEDGFSGSQPKGNVIEGNSIGVAGANNFGVLLAGSNGMVTSTTVGGTTSAAANVISGNTGAGVAITDDTGDTIEGNIIGRDATNTTAVPNGGGGVLVENGSTNDVIGGTAAGAGNVIASNTRNGVTVGSSTSDTTTVGIDIEGNSITANTGLGISLGGSSIPLPNDSIGHSGPNDFQNYPVLSQVTPSGSNVSITGDFGQLDEPNTTLTFNFYGDPGTASGFGQGAVFLGSTTMETSSDGQLNLNNVLVTAPPTGDVVSATATVTATTASGIHVGDTSEFSQAVAPPSTTLTVTNTNATGAGSLEQAITTANSDNLAVQTTIDFDIPTTDPGYNSTTGVWTILVGNGTGMGLPTITVPIVIDGFSQDPPTTVMLTTGAPVIVLDGTDVTGSIGDGLVFGQGTSGSGAGSTVEGLSLVNWKYSSQFGGGTAIDIGSAANPVTIQGNYIGVEPTGTIAGNDVSGITIQSPLNTVGGTTAADRNIIGGNGNNAPSIETGAGIITEDSTENTIFGNYIGVGADGQTRVPNNIGVLMSVDTNTQIGNRLGGTLSGDGNVISGNTEEGVDLDGDEFDLVQGNIIGMNAADTAAVPNGGGGILAHDEALHDTIGGITTGTPANVIAGNTGNGVSVGTNTSPPNSAGIEIEGNSITANTGLGIGLGGFSTPLVNDSEGHVGPNALQNYPVITSAIVQSNGTITIGGTFTEADEPNTTLVADIYADPGTASGFGQGAVFVGTAQIGPTNASGSATFSVNAVDNIPAGDVLTATATVMSPGTPPSGITITDGDTSEFSQDFPLTPTPTPTATQLVVTTPPAPNPVTAGQAFSLTASAEDGSDTVDTTYDQNVTVTIMSGPTGAGLGGTTMMDASAGVASFSDLILDTAGNYTLKLQSGTLTPTTATITVNAGTAEAINVTTLPTPNPVGVGQPFTLVAQIQDDFGNVVTNYTNEVDVSLEAVSPAPPGVLGGTTMATTANGLLANGVATFNNLTLSAPSDYLLQVSSDSLNTFFDIPITVNSATAATQLVVTTAPAPNPVTAGQTFSLTASAEDGSGAVDTTYDQNVTVTIMSGPTGATLGGTTMMTASAGVASFSDLILDTAGNYTLELQSGTLTPTTTTITVNAGTADVVALTTAPTPNPVAVNQTFTLVAAIEDDFGNVVTSYTQPVTVSMESGGPNGTLGGTTMATTANGLLVNGVATYNNLTLNVPGDYLLQVASDSLDSAFDIPLTVNSATAATQLVVTTPPAPNPVTAGQTFSLTASPENGSGTVDTTYDQDVKVTIMSGPAGATLGGTTTMLASAGVASFSGLVLDTAGNYTLALTSGTLTPTTTTITVTAAAVSQLVVTTQPPSTITVNTPFGLAVTAEDQFGNVATSFTGNVALALSTNPGNATLGGTTTVAAQSGVATFSNLTLNSPASGYVLQASSTGVPSVTTAPTTVQPVTGIAPTVTNLQRFGFHAQPTMLVLTFSEALNPTTAQNVANYTVAGASGSFPVTSAVYNPANDTVTLSFSQRLNVHLTYTITVNGMGPSGVTGVNGLLLDGADNGQPGSNYVMMFGSEILAGDAAEATEAPNMLTLEQINHGHMTDKAVEELVAQGKLKVERHHRHATH